MEVKTVKFICLQVALWLTAVPQSVAQGFYPLHAGNTWQYYILPNSYGWTARVSGDTTMPNGFTYRILTKDFGEKEYLRQVGSRVYEYRRRGSTLFEDHILYDFSKTVGDTIFAEYNQGDTLVCTIIQDIFEEKFGQLRRQWLYYERRRPWIFHVLRELTDSIGLTNIEYEASPSYRLTGAILNGRRFGTITNVKEPILGYANQFTLHQNYPNPFNGETQIQLDLHSRQSLSAEVVNALGQRVRLLYAGEMERGTHTLAWDATTDNGKQAASGVYSCLLRGNGYSTATKMVLLR
jgi:hypothetical protein